jgi:acetoin utilization protein AcuB
MAQALTVQAFMTASPHSIGHDQKLSLAHTLMRKYSIRHLPVLDAGKLVGVVTDRDLHLVETLKDVDPEGVVVEEAMSQEVYAVGPGAPLREVAAHMAERKLGSAVVLKGGRVVGVFTTTDALRAVAELAPFAERADSARPAALAAPEPAPAKAARAAKEAPAKAPTARKAKAQTSGNPSGKSSASASRDGKAKPTARKSAATLAR